MNRQRVRQTGVDFIRRAPHAAHTLRTSAARAFSCPEAGTGHILYEMISLENIPAGTCSLNYIQLWVQRIECIDATLFVWKNRQNADGALPAVRSTVGNRFRPTSGNET